MARPKLNITQDMINHAEKLKAQGCNEQEIADGLGISMSSFIRHKDKFRHVLKKGKDVFSNSKLKDVENALLKKALGYEFEEVKTEITKTENGVIEKEVRTIKHLTPDTTAQIFALVNRDPENWQSINKTKVNIDSIPENININFGD